MLPRSERVQIGIHRLQRVLRTQTVALGRTLEQKISDAGPYHLRVDPHILTEAKRALRNEGVLTTTRQGGDGWFHLSETPRNVVLARLKILGPIQAAIRVQDVSMRVGQALEIAVYRALRDQSALPEWLGSFPNLDDHDDSTLYAKEDPPSTLGTRSISGQKRLDFLVRHTDAGWAGIEVKNVRQWLYPNRSEIQDLLEKCYYLDAVPVLMPGTLFHALAFRAPRGSGMGDLQSALSC